MAPMTACIAEAHATRAGLARASVPPLPGVFQQGIAHWAKRPAPCPVHAPAIPAHHESNSFDLLFLVQAPISFLFYM